jgi:hypothetical protein
MSKNKNLVLNVFLFVLVLIAIALFVKYFSAVLVSLGMAKASAVSISKLIAALGMFFAYVQLKEKLLNDNLKETFDSSVFQEMMRKSVNRRRAYHGF